MAADAVLAGFSGNTLTVEVSHADIFWVESEPATFGAFSAEFVASTWTDRHCGPDGLTHHALSSLVEGQSTCDTFFL